MWITDRDAGRVYGLDRDLLVVRELPLRAPIEVEACADGGAWVVSALDGGPVGRHQLARLDRDGVVGPRAALGTFHDLACDAEDRALVIEDGPAGRRVALFDGSAQLRWQAQAPGALSLASAWGQVLVGDDAGVVSCFDLGAPAAPPRSSALGGILADVAAGPSAESWWVLDASAAHRLVLLDADLSARWIVPAGVAALHLAPVSGVERVWLADVNAPSARRFGPGGALEVDRRDLPLAGLDRVASLAGGGALFAAPGALLALDGLGRNAPGQGGFDFLVDVAVVP